LRQQRTRLVSITDAGTPLPTGGTNPVLSANARYVAFESLIGSNIYRHDLLATGAGATTVVCSNCSRPSITGDGALVAFVQEGQAYVVHSDGTSAESLADFTN